MAPSLLAIAGLDPTGGAGLVLDIRVFNSRGWMGLGIATAVTSQNTQKVFDVFCMSRKALRRQYEAIREDIPIAGIKIGMMGCAKNLEVLGRILEDNPGIPVVADTVFRAGSGYWLFESAALDEFVRTIKGRVSLITPNIPEASLLLKKSIDTAAKMRDAAEILCHRTGAPCLLKGGHLPGQKVDILFDGNTFQSFPHPSIQKKVHGTGCFLSSNLLCFLAAGYPLGKTVKASIDLTLEAIRNAVPAGKGQNLIDWTRSPSGPTRRRRSRAAEVGLDPGSDSER